jgi:hypothetical protein
MIIPDAVLIGRRVQVAHPQGPMVQKLTKLPTALKTLGNSARIPVSN